MTAAYYTSEIQRTEADNEYVPVSRFCSPSEAGSEILSILNNIVRVYEEQLRLCLEVVYQHAWTTELEAYTSTEAGGLLDEFKEHWNGRISSLGDSHAVSCFAKCQTGVSNCSGIDVGRHCP